MRYHHALWCNSGVGDNRSRLRLRSACSVLLWNLCLILLAVNVLQRLLLVYMGLDISISITCCLENSIFTLPKQFLIFTVQILYCNSLNIFRQLLLRPSAFDVWLLVLGFCFPGFISFSFFTSLSLSMPLSSRIVRSINN